MQGIALYIIAIFFACYPNDKLDIMCEEKRLQEKAGGPGKARRITNENMTEAISARSAISRNINPNREGSIPLLSDICALLSNPVYMSTMFVISSMYFSSTGL